MELQSKGTHSLNILPGVVSLNPTVIAGCVFLVAIGALTSFPPHFGFLEEQLSLCHITLGAEDSWCLSVLIGECQMGGSEWLHGKR